MFFYNLNELTLKYHLSHFFHLHIAENLKFPDQVLNLYCFLEIAGYNFLLLKEGSHKIRFLGIFVKY